ncbi:hypothetical protein FRC05_001605 [Tulasnella sp. 425]|nr:hypothetical protein FRC05_001605 [Tulasnella sp. 425]
MSLNNLDHNKNLDSVSAGEEEEEEEYARYLADDIDAALFDSFFPSGDSSEDQAGTPHSPPPIITESTGSDAVSLGDERGGCSRTGSDSAQTHRDPSTRGKTTTQATAAFRRPQALRAEAAEAQAATLPQRGRPAKGWADRIGAEIQFRAPGKVVAANDANHSSEWDQARLRSGRLGVHVQKVNKSPVLPSIDRSGLAPSALNLVPSIVIPNSESGDPGSHIQLDSNTQLAIQCDFPTTPYTVGGSNNYAVRADDIDTGSSVMVNEEDDGDVWDGMQPDGVGEDNIPVEDEVTDLGSERSDSGRTRSERGNPEPLSSGGQSTQHLPPWVVTAFKAATASPLLAEKSATHMPKLYSEHGSFWLPSPSPIFKLRSAENALDLNPAAIYQPRFFYWDPQPLVPSGSISCPISSCNAILSRHGTLDHPRRVVGLEDLYWLIGVRYRCPSCINPKTKRKGTVTFTSWDSRILASLPPSLASLFPAQLTARSGLDKTVLRLLRSACGNGVGPKQFADMLSNLHHRQHDERHLLYVNTILAGPGGRGIGKWPKDTLFEPFGKYSDPKGYGGFIPSSQWLRDIYDGFIESRMDDFNQHTAMLPLDVGALDHSHKVTKHIALIDGVPTYTALMSITNQYGDIRGSYLCTSKAHSQFEPALHSIAKSLPQFSHRPPQLFFTDNVDDAPLLKRCFPSLAEGVIPVDKNASLPLFTIPSEVTISILYTTNQINNAMKSIMDTLVVDSRDQSLVIGLDAEWNVRPGSSSISNTAVMQIAFENHVYIIPIARFTAKKELPRSICAVLQSSRIHKVGRMVENDLKRLASEAYTGCIFTGAVELAQLAKQRSVIPTARTSLSELVALTLKHYLEKDQSIRVSEDWDRETLSDDQVRYAATDAYASLAVYNALMEIPVPGNLPLSPAPGLPISIWHDDGSRLIAHGIVAEQVNHLQGINVTQTRLVVTVQQVLVPSSVVIVRQTQDLASDPVPFNVVVQRRKLQTRPTSAHLMPHQDSTAPTTKDSSTPAPPVGNEHGTSESSDSDALDTVGSLMASEEFHPTLEPDAPALPTLLDPESAATGEAILKEVESLPWKTEIRSRIAKDCFHVMNGIPISRLEPYSRVHALKRPFARALRDAILIPDQEDRHRLSIELAKIGMTFEHFVRTNPRSAWQHVKRIIPPPEQLLPAVQKVFTTYGPLPDAKTGLPLFNAAAWHAAKNALKLIKNGYLSDPPGIPLYHIIGFDKHMNNLPIYHCFRGTNSVEGGVHQNIRRRVALSGATPRHTEARLTDYILRHNLIVGTLNRTGQRYVGHFDIWLLNDLQTAMSRVQDWVRDAPVVTGWVNGRLYTPTCERFGILPIPPNIQNEMGMVPFIPSCPKNQSYRYLAQQQNVRYATLPVHTAGEKKLFTFLMCGNAEFCLSNPNWTRCAREWNQYANGVEIYYKTGEQLKTYHGTWSVNANEKLSLVLSEQKWRPVDDELRDPTRSVRAPAVPCSEPSLAQPSKGLIESDASASPPCADAEPESDGDEAPHSSQQEKPLERQIRTASEKRLHGHLVVAARIRNHQQKGPDSPEVVANVV